MNLATQSYNPIIRLFDLDIEERRNMHVYQMYGPNYNP